VSASPRVDRARWDGWRLYLTVAACAIVVYLGALGNRFALDDISIIFRNGLVHHLSGVWRAFAAPYWPRWYEDFSAYRPLPIASYALDWAVGTFWWFHTVNLVWHAAASVLVAMLARRYLRATGALAAGLLFAVHPVHVEAVANVIGRAELMAAVFALLAVYAALVRGSILWSTVALAFGLLSKENAAVVPGLIVWAWILDLGRPTRRRALGFVGAWVGLGAAYGLVRWLVLYPHPQVTSVAPVFLGASALDVRLTAIAAVADFTRLLLVPLTLRVDYSPAERTLVTSFGDPRFLAGAFCVLAWIFFIVLAWKRRERMIAFGLGWIGIALAPVANLFFPIGVLIAERTLYLPSVGLVLVAGALLERLPVRAYAVALGLLTIAGGVRSALRVPVWLDNNTLLMSILNDSPHSYAGPAQMGDTYLQVREPQKALAAFERAIEVYPMVPRLYMEAADAAMQLGRYRLADSLLARHNQLCRGCTVYYNFEINAARTRGDTTVADSLRAYERRRGDE